MILYTLSALGGLIAGSGLTYLTIRNPLKENIKKNNETAEYNKLLQEEQNKLIDEIEKIQSSKSELQIDYSTFKNEINEKKSLLESSLAALETSISKTQENFELSVEQLESKYRENEENYQKEYISVMKDLTNELELKFQQKEKEIDLLSDNIEEKRKTIAAIIESFKRTEEQKNSANYYRLILTKEEIEEIRRLKEVGKYLQNAEPLNKVIWSCYYKNAYSSLIGRVLGKGKKITGIYKITNLKNNMCYVGQSVDVSERWSQHIKRGLGAETATQNKLYPAMKEFGPENFSFELVEECSQSKLSEREKFWTDFYKAQEFGYSIRKG